MIFSEKTKKIRIKKLGAKDILSISKLENECFNDPWSKNSIRLCLDGGALFLGAYRGGALCGYGGIMLAADYGEIINLAVSPGARREGIGGELLFALINRARARGAALITLEVRKSNLPAIALYENAGFLRVGVRRAYYSDNGEDAIVMALNLAAAGRPRA